MAIDSLPGIALKPSSAPFLERLQKLPERYLSALLLLVILVVFVTFNKGALQSYFSDDDFANLAMFEPWWSVIKASFSLALTPNFRPVGAMFYKAMGSLAGFHFAAYIAILQAFHIATALLLWLFLRRLGLPPLPAALGCAFFALHMSTLPAYWKPMYIFDVLCGFWVILALLLYQRDRFFLSFLCAWLAFKSKEMELMLPVVLLLYEWCFGRERNSGKLRWKPLVPFFLMSFSFGLQSLMLKGPETHYTVHLTASNLWSGVAYYGGKLLYAPLSGLILSIGLLLLRVRAITFGVVGFWILMATMFAFPGRQSGAYLYVPLLMFSVAVAGVAQSKPWWAVLFLVLWIPASYDQLRTERKPIIAYHYDHIPYVNQILQSLAVHPAPTAVVYDGTPSDFNQWGQRGLFPFALARSDLQVYSTAEPEAQEAIRRPGALLFTWDEMGLRLRTNSFVGDGREMSYVDFGKDNPFWQLKSGWMPLAKGCRWTGLRSAITLRQPKGDVDFSMGVNLMPGQAEKLHQLLRVASGSQTIGVHRFIKGGMQTLTWPVSSGAESVKDFEISVDPAFYLPNSDALGVIVCECGFLPHAQEH
jgi:hypothetical protein